jgi:hypothetical protein
MFVSWFAYAFASFGFWPVLAASFAFFFFFFFFPIELASSPLQLTSRLTAFHLFPFSCSLFLVARDM